MPTRGLPTTITPGSTGHIGDTDDVHGLVNPIFADWKIAGVKVGLLADLPTDLDADNIGFTYFASDAPRSSKWWDGTAWQSLGGGGGGGDSGKVNVMDFGAVGDGVTDDAVAFEDAIDYSLDNGGIVFAPGTFLGYKIGHTILLDLSTRGGQGRRGVVISCGGSPNTLSPNVGIEAPQTTPPMTKIIGPGGDTPTFSVKTISVPLSIWNGHLINSGASIDYGGVAIPTAYNGAGPTESDLLDLHGTTLQSTLAGREAMTIRGGFWVCFGNSDGNTAVVAANATSPGVRIVHGGPTAGVAIGPIRFTNVTFKQGGLQIDNYDDGTIAIGGLIMDNCVSEDFVNKAMVTITGIGGIATLAEYLTFRNCAHADATGTCPILELFDANVTSLSMINSQGQGNVNVRQNGTSRVFGYHSIGQQGSFSARPLLLDQLGQMRGDAIIQSWCGFDYVVRTNTPSTAWKTDRGGAPFRIGRDTEDHARGYINQDLDISTGPGGSTGGIDTVVGRIGSSSWGAKIGQLFLGGELTYMVNHTLITSDLSFGNINMQSASPIALTIPTESTIGYPPPGTRLRVVAFGAGPVNIAAGGGVTIQSRGGLTHILGALSMVELFYRGFDYWLLTGELV